MLVFMCGCSLNCPNCQNPAIRDPNVGSNISIDELKEQLLKRPLCKSITFTGGDPLFQEEKLIPYCAELSKITKIAVYTGKSINDVPTKLLQHISFLKTEPYIEKLGPVSAITTNQKCWDVVNGVAIENKQCFEVK